MVFSIPSRPFLYVQKAPHLQSPFTVHSVLPRLQPGPFWFAGRVKATCAILNLKYWPATQCQQNM